MTSFGQLSFGELLRKLRTDAGMTQEHLAQAAGLHIRTLSDLERRNEPPRKPTVRLLADALGLSGQQRLDFEGSAASYRVDYGGITLRLLNTDALRYSTNILALKYAQESFGLDEQVAEIAGVDIKKLPAVGQSLLIAWPSGIAASAVLFVGVEPIDAFDYRSIRDFSRRALGLAATRAPLPVDEIAMTLHGVGFGLDEIEALESEVAGIIEAIDSGNFPGGLRAVSILESNQGRANRLGSALIALVGSAWHDKETAGQGSQSRRVDSAGYDSASRGHAFVAMPFAESFQDIFYYGIAPPVRSLGLLCERMDQIRFAGDVIDRMKERIASSAIVIADLSEANPNVYLEVGYAWGLRIPCILLCNRQTELKFDVRGQRCIFYGSIRELEDNLKNELPALLRR